MRLADYLLEQAGKDWPSLLEGWRDELPAQFTLWLVDRFGDLFLVLDDGSVWMLDVGAGSLSRLADDRDHFAQLIDEGDNANKWLMIPLVEECVAQHMTLLPNQCYGFKIPPLLGGKYEVTNVEPTDLAVHYSLLADIHRQTKDVPDGTAVKAVVVE